MNSLKVFLYRKIQDMQEFMDTRQGEPFVESEKLQGYHEGYEAALKQVQEWMHQHEDAFKKEDERDALRAAVSQSELNSL